MIPFAIRCACALLAALALACLAALGANAEDAPVSSATAAPTATAAAAAETANAPSASEPAPAKTSAEFKSLDSDVQGLKKEVLDLNKDLFQLEEELLFPANTQVAVFLSVDVGTYFQLDSVQIKVDNKEVQNYLYTDREVDSLNRGGVQRVYLGNVKVGKHELVAFFTGQGPHERDYKRGAKLNFEKGVGAKYLELKISDRQSKEQPEFMVKAWE